MCVWVFFLRSLQIKTDQIFGLLSRLVQICLMDKQAQNKLLLSRAAITWLLTFGIPPCLSQPLTKHMFLSFWLTLIGLL